MKKQMQQVNDCCTKKQKQQVNDCCTKKQMQQVNDCCTKKQKQQVNDCCTKKQMQQVNRAFLQHNISCETQKHKVCFKVFQAKRVKYFLELGRYIGNTHHRGR